MTKHSISTLIKPKMDLSEGNLKAAYENLLTSFPSDACLGRFKRLRCGDSGKIRLIIQNCDSLVTH